MNELAQYFTKDAFSSLLASSIDIQNPKVVIDLGIGNGSLTAAAQKKWKNAAFFGVDLDTEKVASLTQANSNVSLFNLNSLDVNLAEKIDIKVGSVDIAVCNPPYLVLERKDEYAKLLENAGLNNSIKLLSYTTDLLFIAQNLSLLKDGGILGVILPAGLLCGHNFRYFRKDLIDNHSIQMVIELESKIFKKTEAKTFILIVKKGKSSVKNILLSVADKAGKISDKIFVKKQDLQRRMDFQFHSKKHSCETVGIPLKDLVFNIARGNYSNLDLRSLNVPYFHTTDFKKYETFIEEINHNYDTLSIKPYVAQKGDILIGRVGKTCHKQVLMVKSGSLAVSDCIYIIRAPKIHQNRIFRYFKSPKGMENLSFLKHGVCAQVISKQDLNDILIS